MKKACLLATFLLGLVAQQSSAVKHKALWIEKVGDYHETLREAISAQGPMLHLSETRSEADLVLSLDERGPDYSQILYREKFGRRDAKSLVARDARTGKVVLRENLTPAHPPSRTAAARFATRLADLP